MKRIRIYKVYALLLVTIVTVFTACTQDLTETKNIESDEGLTVTIDDDEQATRAIVIDNPGIRLETTWTAGDQLGIFGAGQSNEPYTINASTISDDGRTAAFTSTASIPSGDLLAYYPYNVNATQSDDQLHLTFPKTQHYTVAGIVPLPDPEACVMAGKGSEATGVNMRNVMAVLKVGQVFATPTTVKSVEFRDLSGKSVCGDYTVTMTGGIPQTTFDGTGDVLTLDMGEGVKAEDGSAFIVFLVVPARDYPKGFEITFVDTEGQRTVRTTGTKNGKTLNRSVVHPVGDIGTYQNVEGMSYELMPTAHIIKPDDLELVKILRLTTDAHALDEDGMVITAEDGYIQHAPAIEAFVHRDLNPQVGGWLIFNLPTPELPQGGMFRIKKCRALPDGENYEVEAVSECNIAAPFKSFVVGEEPTFDENGNLLEDRGQEFDITPYVKEIVEKDDNDNILSRSAIYPQASYEMNAGEQLTRATSRCFTTPPMTLTMDDNKHCACEVSTKAKINTRLAVRAMDGKLQYIYLTVSPTFDLKTTFSLYAKMEKKKQKRLYTLYCLGIAVGPIVVVPEISFNGSIGAGCEAKMSASTTFHYDLGTYGVSYNAGQGLLFRHQDPAPPAKDDSFMPELGAGAEANVYAFGSLGMSFGASIYAMCSLGVNADLKLTFGVKKSIDHGSYQEPAKLHLTPELDFAPYTAFLGGKYLHVADGLGVKIEFDPIWERHLVPEYVTGGYWFRKTYTNSAKDLIKFKLTKEQNIGLLDLCIGCTGAGYDITWKGKTLFSYDLYIDVYEGSGVEFAHDDNSIALPGWDINDPKYGLEAFRSAGLLHLAPTFVKCKYWFTGLTLTHRYKIGTFEAGKEEEQRFVGTVDFTIPSGNPSYLGGNRVRIGGTPEDLYGPEWSNSPYAGNAAQYVWFYWPNNSNGGPYPWAEGAGIGVIKQE